MVAIVHGPVSCFNPLFSLKIDFVLFVRVKSSLTGAVYSSTHSFSVKEHTAGSPTLPVQCALKVIDLGSLSFVLIAAVCLWKQQPSSIIDEDLRLV
jgi:hypothetical protein